MKAKPVRVRALRTQQGKDNFVYSFFMPGKLITQIADISRVHRNDEHELEGFQRKTIKNHVKSIVDYLDQGDVIFPNAIILSFSPEVTFKGSRGRKVDDVKGDGEVGTLEIPARGEGERVAWIVDGQQRSLALSMTKTESLSVPVVAFETADLNLQREQFILVNKAKPLPTRLINELLPEVDTYLPKDLAPRKVPSQLCNLLNKDKNSPFFGLIRRVSSEQEDHSVLGDTAVIQMIRVSINNPLGALSQYKSLGSEPSDIESMYQTLVTFWGVVQEVFPDAWGKSPRQSRLMHGAGISAMGTLMDRIYSRCGATEDPRAHIKAALANIAPHCCWTAGQWPDIGIEWNEIQNVSKHIKKLSDQLIKLDYLNNRTAS